MAIIVVTPRALNTAHTKPTYSEFSTTSTTFVDITGATGMTVPDTLLYICAHTYKGTGGGPAQAKIIDTPNGVTITFAISNSGGFDRKIVGPVKNLSGVTLTFKGQMKVFSGSGTITSQANGHAVGASPLVNLSDFFIKASVSKIRVWSAGSVTEAILGISAGTNDANGFAETDIDSLIDGGFIFSANSGLTLWDFSGNTIEVTP